MSVGVCLLPLHGKDSSTGAKTAGRPSHAGPASLHRGQSQRDRSRAATAACVCGCRGGREGGTPPLDVPGPGPGPGLDAAQPWWSGASAPSWRAPIKCTHGRAPPPSVRSPPARPRGGPAETRSPHTGRARHHSADQPWGFPRRYFPRTVPGWTVAHHCPRREVARVQLRPPLAKGIECRNSRALLNLI